MEYNITDKKFMMIKGISHIRNYQIKIMDYELKNETIDGNLEIEINYIDNNELEGLFHTLLPFSIFLDEGKIGEINYRDEVLNVIDNQGVELEYILTINYEVEFTEIKEEIKEEVESKLMEILKERDDSFLEETANPILMVPVEEKAETIMPKLNESYKTTKIVCFNSLKEVSEKYKVSEGKLITGLINDHIVMFDE